MDQSSDNNPPQLRQGTIYSSTRGATMRPAWDLLERLNLRREERLLITPARDGELLTLVAAFHRGGKIMAVEEESHLYRRCQEQIKTITELATEVVVVKETAHHVPGRGQQDALLSHCYMPAIPKFKEFLNALPSNLRPGGRFAIQIPITPFCQPLEESLRESLAKADDLPDFEELCPIQETDEVDSQLEGRAFREAETMEKVYLQDFDNAFSACHTIFEGGGWTGLDQLTETAKHGLAVEMQLRLSRRLGTNENVQLPFRRLIVWGRR